MDRFQQLTQAANKLTADEFARQHNHLYLYGSVPESSAMVGYGTFVTAPTMSEMPRGRSSRGRASTFVDVIEKSGRNDWMRRISVGRSSNNDIIFRHESVSKLHAYFFVRATRRKLKRVEELVLVDAGSSNGTLHNGRSVSRDPDQGKVMAFGDRIAFGEVESEFVDVMTLYQVLRRQDRFDF